MYAQAANCIFDRQIERLSKFAARPFLQRSVQTSVGSARFQRFAGLHHAEWPADGMIDLESAAFMFHMMATTQGITGHCEPRVLSRATVSGLPLQLTETDAPNTRVSLTPSRAPGEHRRAPAFFNGKNPPFDLLSGFRPCRSHLACAQGRELSHAHAHPGSNHPSRAAGRDVVGIAQTGTGKTASFALPILHRILENRIKTAAQGLPRAGAVADARTVRADPRQLQRLWPPHPPDLDAGDRRRPDGTPGPRDHARRRSAGRHARPAARSRAEQRAETRTGRVSGARRGRPHARHGLHQRHPEDRRKLPVKRQTLFFSRRCPRISRSSPRPCCGIPRGWR